MHLFCRRLIAILLPTVAILTILGADHGRLNAAVGAASAPRPPASPVLITGAVSEATWWRRESAGGADTPCLLFLVSVSPPHPPLVLTTAGLGRARLAPAPGGRCPAAGTRAWREDLPLPENAVLHRRPIALRLDPDAPPPEGGLLEGRVIALAGTAEAGAAVLKVRERPDPPWWQAVQWALPLVASALLAFVATRAGPILDARQRFFVYRVLEVEKIEGTMDSLQAVLGDPDVKPPGRYAYAAIRDGGVLAALTNRRQRRIADLCYEDDMDGLVKLMKRLFPRQTESLEIAPPSKPKKRGR